MTKSSAEHELAYLLDYDGARYLFEKGYWVKFEVKQTPVSRERPHGLAYSFTLHDPNGTRLLGFDNAHGVRPMGGRYKRRTEATDHWHRTELDGGRPYAFSSALKLVEDFLREVERVLADHGVSAVIQAVKEQGNDGSNA